MADRAPPWLLVHRVAVANHPIRRTLANVGFTVHSPRTDFALALDGPPTGP